MARRLYLPLVLATIFLLTACSPASRLGFLRTTATTVTVEAPPAATPNLAPTIQAAVDATVQASRPTATAVVLATPTPPVRQLTNENWALAVGDVFTYRNVPVVLTGRIAEDFQLSNTSIGFVMYTNPVTKEGEAIVAPSPLVSVKPDDYVRVQGTVTGVFDGHDASGGTVHGPQIRANKVEVITRGDALAPTVKTYDVNKPISQNSVTISLTKIELAEKETRVYLSVENSATQKVIVAPSAVRVVQTAHQFAPQNLPDSGYPQLPSAILPGVKADAVIVFDAVSPAQPLSVFWDGITFSDTTVKFVPYVWTAGP